MYVHNIYATVIRPPDTVPRQNPSAGLSENVFHIVPPVERLGHTHAAAALGVCIYNRLRVHGVLSGIYLSPTISALANFTGKHGGTCLCDGDA